MKAHSIRRTRGASLVEVLIALVLVAVTMLGLLALQLRSQSLQKDSIDRRNAAIMAADFLERVTANFAGFRGNAYAGLAFNAGDAVPGAPGACANANACNPNEMRDRDWYALRRDVSGRLPGGVAFVDSPPLVVGGGARWVSVTVGWIDPGRTVAELNPGGVAPGPDPLCPAALADTRYRCYVARGFP